MCCGVRLNTARWAGVTQSCCLKRSSSDGQGGMPLDDLGASSVGYNVGTGHVNIAGGSQPGCSGMQHRRSVPDVPTNQDKTPMPNPRENKIKTSKFVNQDTSSSDEGYSKIRYVSKGKGKGKGKQLSSKQIMEDAVVWAQNKMENDID